jgi:hypothetical protein
MIKHPSKTVSPEDLANGFANNGPGRARTRLESLADYMPVQQVKSMIMDGAERFQSCYGSEGWVRGLWP